jgi:hypothetical protein
MQLVTGIWRDIIRNTVMCPRNFGIQNAVFHMNLESYNVKYINVSEEFTDTECSMSQEFRDQWYEIR